MNYARLRLISLSVTWRPIAARVGDVLSDVNCTRLRLHSMTVSDTEQTAQGASGRAQAARNESRDRRQNRGTAPALSDDGRTR